LPLVRFNFGAWLGRAGVCWSVVCGPVWDRPLREEGTAL